MSEQTGFKRILEITSNKKASVRMLLSKLLFELFGE